jgi:DNA-binding transcriptional LysR family regulator
MELRDLRSFIAVAEELSFTRAAQRLRIAQPPLSQRIKQFEAELGAPLFARTKRRVSLTEAGRALLPLARQILAAADTAAQTVQMVGAGRSGTIVIGAFYSAIYTVLPEIIRPFATAYPSVDIQIREMIVTQQLKALREGLVDVGIVRLERVPSDLRTIDLLDEELVAALNVDHPLAAGKTVSLRKLAQDPLITLDPDFNNEFHMATKAAFAAHGLSPDIMKQAPDMHLVLGLVSAGLGVALVPSSLAQISQRYIAFRPIREKTQGMKVRLAWRADTLSPIVPHFVEMAKRRA